MRTCDKRYYHQYYLEVHQQGESFIGKYDDLIDCVVTRLLFQVNQRHEQSKNESP